MKFFRSISFFSRLAAVCLLAGALGLMPAGAAVLFNNGAPDQVSGDNMTEFIQAEDFQIFGPANVTNIRFWTLQSVEGDYSGSVWWAIFSDATGAPGVILQGGAAVALIETATGASSGFGYSEYVIDIPVSFGLASGTYWLGLHNGGLTNTGLSDMLWGTTAPGFGIFGQYDASVSGAGPWFSTEQEHAFLIEGDPVGEGVPEPGTFVLLGSGLALASLLRRKRRQPLSRVFGGFMRTSTYLVLSALLAVGVISAQVEGPIIIHSSANAVSPSLSEIAIMGRTSRFDVGAANGYVQRDQGVRKQPIAPSTGIAPSLTVPASTPVLQTANPRTSLGATVVANFEALGLGTPGYSVLGAPPDTTLGTSPTQIVQWVNTHIAVYDKTGVPLLPAPGFVAGNSIWAALGAGSLCATTNRGDPLVQYDRYAGHWVLSQFAFNASFTANSQCFAVSTTSSALGTYNLYEFSFGTSLPDYGKLGVWPDAYYVTYNMFLTGSSFAGGRACAYDKAAMIAGSAATSICFNSTSRFSFLPADLEGTALPPAGMPNPHISWNWAFLAAPPYTMQLTKFHVDFVTPALSTFDDGLGGGAFSFVGFSLDGTASPLSGTYAPCADLGSGACIPQPATAQKLDTLGDRPMYRLTYRNFGGFDSLMFTQSIDPAGAQVAAVRWWEIRNPMASPPIVYQNSTYSPADGQNRWMGSGATDKLGNFAIGYSVGSATLAPGIRIAGKLRTEPRNILRGEQSIIVGVGSQTSGLSRWGDYSTMQIDPADDCTFWYTNQYQAASGTFNWNTRIAGFKFPNCH